MRVSEVQLASLFGLENPSAQLDTGSVRRRLFRNIITIPMLFSLAMAASEKLEATPAAPEKSCDLIRTMLMEQCNSNPVGTVSPSYKLVLAKCFPKSGSSAFDRAQAYLQVRAKALRSSFNPPELAGKGASSNSPWSVKDSKYVSYRCSENPAAGKPVQTAEFGSSEQRLTVLGVVHAHYYNGNSGNDVRKESLYRTVTSTIKDRSPKIVLVEGVPSEWGPMPCQQFFNYLDFDPSALSEQERAKEVAISNGIPFAGWEPTDRSMASFVGTHSAPHGLTGDDLFFYRLHEVITSLYFQNLSQKHIQHGDIAGLNDVLRMMCQKKFKELLQVISGAPAPSTADCAKEKLDLVQKKYRTWFKKTTQKDLFEFNLSQGIPSDFMPEQIERTKNQLRDAHLRLVSKEALDRFGNVLVIAGNESALQDGRTGCGHLSANYEIFRRNLGMATEKEKTKPDSTASKAK